MKSRADNSIFPPRLHMLLSYLIFVPMMFGSQATRVRSPEHMDQIFPPYRVGGASGSNDQRDADIYPNVAFDPRSGRYLVVWMSVRNAGSSSSGFDIYGRFLDRNGQPLGDEFRISDQNSVARNGIPTLAAGNGEFAVAWTTRGPSCQIYVQRVNDTSNYADKVILYSTAHNHSPSLAYDPNNKRYLLAYVEGDDYLPATVLGAQTADCGNNVASTSTVKAIGFDFNGDDPAVQASLNISDAQAGGFRPHLAYSIGLNQSLITWEDRRNAGDQAYRFDVYAQRVGENLTILGNDIALALGGSYSNYDNSTTWTPRPRIAAGEDNFIAIWFSQEAQDSVILWSVQGRLISANGIPGAAFNISQIPFAQSHSANPPSAFLAAAYLNTVKEFLVGITNHLESIWGYLSFALIQRVNRDGQLLKMDGTSQTALGVGYSIDYENDDQIGIGIAENPFSGFGTADYMIVYAKHSKDRPAQDFDIWAVRVQLPALYQYRAYAPVISE